MKKQLVAITVALLQVAFAHAQDKSAPTAQTFNFTVQQAVDYALQNHASVQNAVLDEQNAREKVREITGIGLPQINGSIDVKDFLDIPTQVLPAKSFNPLAPDDALFEAKFGIQYNASAGVEISQLVFDGTYLVGLKASKVYMQLASKAATRTKIETMAAVKKAYFMVLVNDERMKLLDANVARIKKLADDTKVLNENGFVEKVDLDRVTVAYNNLLVEKDKVTKLVTLSNLLLKYQIGMDQSNTLILTDKMIDLTIDAATLSAEKFDYSKRIEYSLVESQNIAAQLMLKKDRIAYAPNFLLYGSFSKNAFRMEFDFFDFSKKWYPASIVGARIGIPIFDGMQKHYRIQQSKIGLQKSENDLRFIKQSIDLEVASSRTNLENTSASLNIQKQNITLAEDVYKTTKLKYEQGVGSSLEVLNAETALKEAQTNYYNALYDALVAKIDYEKATGTLK